MFFTKQSKGISISISSIIVLMAKKKDRWIWSMSGSLANHIYLSVLVNLENWAVLWFTAGMAELGEQGRKHPPQILVDQKTELSCHITTRQPRFSDLPPSLDWLSCLARTREETKWSGLNLLLYFLCLILLQKGDPKLQNSLFAPSTLCCPQ